MMNRTQGSSFTLMLSLLVLGGLPHLIVGCAGSRPTTPIHEASLGSVFLEQASDSSFQASHPIKLSETTIADVLRGIHTKEKAGFLLLLGKAAKSTNLNDIRTFSEDDIAFLTPHIAAALAQATPTQRVGFRSYSTSIAPSVKTAPQRDDRRLSVRGRPVPACHPDAIPPLPGEALHLKSKRTTPAPGC